jgi:hypothetical protein
MFLRKQEITKRKGRKKKASKDQDQMISMNDDIHTISVDEQYPR